MLGSCWAGLLSCACQPAAPAAQVERSCGSQAEAPLDSPLARLWLSSQDAPDPRFALLPSRIDEAELVPGTSLVVESAAPVDWIKFVVDGVPSRAEPYHPVLDLSSKTAALLMRPGVHEVSVFVGRDSVCAGPEVLSWDSKFEVVSASDAAYAPVPDPSTVDPADSGETRDLSAAPETKGAAPEPRQGHQAFLFWRTSEGNLVTKTAAGDFVDRRGQVVLSHDQVELRIEDEQGRYVSHPDAPTSIAFAFQILLPMGFRPGVKYPLFVHLHHGWEIFFGTDNDGAPLEKEPVFAGPHSLIHSETGRRLPAIILLPQLPERKKEGELTLEWGAFTHLDNERGTVDSADDPSEAARHLLWVMGQLLGGRLPIQGQLPSVDPSRLYLAGHSMGGLGAWDLSARFPHLWAGVLIMAGYPDHRKAERVAHLPIWAFHHRQDAYNPFGGTKTMAKLVASRSHTHRMKFSPLEFDVQGQGDQAHFRTPNAVYEEDTKALMWLFSQVNHRPDVAVLTGESKSRCFQASQHDCSKSVPPRGIIRAK